MKVSNFSLICCLLPFCALPSLSLDASDDIDTNRPSFSDSPLVVPKGSLQVENGSGYQHLQHGTNYVDAPQNEIRIGLTRGTEFQMFTPNWALINSPQAKNISISSNQPTSASAQTAGGVQTGVYDLNDIGIKQAIKTPLKNFNLAFIGAVNVPTGKPIFSSTGVQPVLRAPWNRVIGKWSVGGMQSILVLNSGQNVQWQNFWLINRSLGAKSSAFIEYVGFVTHHSAANNIMHFGAVRKLNAHNQIDIHFGIGLDKTAPAALVGVGYSFRFDHLPLID